MLYQAEGEFSQVQDALEKARRFAHKYHLADLHERAKGLQALYQLSAGKIEAVARWAKSSGWDSSIPFGQVRFFNDLIILCILPISNRIGEADRISKAGALLEWRLDDAESQNRMGVILKCVLLQVCLHQAQGESEAALAALVQALALAESETFIRPFLDAGKRSKPCCDMCRVRIPRARLHKPSLPMAQPRKHNERMC
ncbi:MAG: hypothetical protein IPO36_14670 [Anaerolineales bacterium]|nr:hypothetical protein [Anaerolineales bacterium]